MHATQGDSISEWRSHTRDFWFAVHDHKPGANKQFGLSDEHHYESAGALAKAISCVRPIRAKLKESMDGVTGGMNRKCAISPEIESIL